jgi:hypothetical protein
MLATGEALAGSVFYRRQARSDVIEAGGAASRGPRAFGGRPAHAVGCGRRIDAMLRAMEADNSANYIPTGLWALTMTGGCVAANLFISVPARYGGFPPARGGRMQRRLITGSFARDAMQQ